MPFFFFKQKTAYEMRISDWSSDVCSSDLAGMARMYARAGRRHRRARDRAPVHRRRNAHFDPPRLAPLPSGLHEIIGDGGEIGRATCRERVGQYVEISVVAAS